MKDYVTQHFKPNAFDLFCPDNYKRMSKRKPRAHLVFIINFKSFLNTKALTRVN